MRLIPLAKNHLWIHKQKPNRMRNDDEKKYTQNI